MEEILEYHCRRVTDNTTISWEQLDTVNLVQTLDGSPPRLQTEVQLAYDDYSLYIRYECEDDHVVANMLNRDDPLYEEDVVEIFIDRAGTGERYYEFELSPLNTLFDAEIAWRDGKRFDIRTEWDADGIKTKVQPSSREGYFNYLLTIPLHNFGPLPEPGEIWRMNLYRIDDDVEGARHYWAWSPTGLINFHRPNRFGKLIFV